MAMSRVRVRLVLLLLGIFAISFSASAAAADDSSNNIDEKDVLVLTKDNFDKIVPGVETMLVAFVAPWCGHCKALKPDFAEAATILKKNDPPIPLAKVDATAESDVARRFNVNGYPTLLIFRHGKHSEYKGPRKADGIVSFMKRQVGPAARPIKSASELQKLLESEKVNGYVVAGYFAPSKTTSLLHSAFLLTANKLRDDVLFAKISDASVAQTLGLISSSSSSDGDAVAAFKTYDEEKVVKYTGKPKTKELEQFITKNSLPVVGEYSADTAAAYAKRGLPLLKFYTKIDWKANPKSFAYYLTRLKRIASTFADQLLVTFASSSAMHGELSAYGLVDGQTRSSSDHQPAADRILIEANEKRFVFFQPPQTQAQKAAASTSSFPVEDIVAFIQRVLKGEEAAYVKSEPVPVMNDGPVKVVVGKTFDQIVEDEDKDVLIEFYAPWCGHCRSLEPKYEKLAQKLKNRPGVVIAKMDATANDWPVDRYRVTGYPTLLFKPAGLSKSDPLKTYDGERETDAMYEWLKKNAKNFHKKAKKEKKKKSLF